MKKNFKGIREKEQGNKFITEDITRHPEGDSPKDLQTQNHVITRTNRAECGAVCQNDRLSAGHIWQTRSHVYGEVKCQAEIQSDVVIPNELGNGETCQGLRHWRLLSNLKNNFSKPVRNDMKNKTVTNLFPYFPISLSLKKKLRRFRIKSGMTFIKQPAFTLAEVLITLGIIGVVAAMTIPTLITNYQKKQTVTKLQKAISIVNQAYRLAYDDVGELSINDAFLISGKDYFDKYWAPYIKVLTYCDTPQKCGYKDNNFYRYPGTISGYNVVTTERNGITFFTADGFLYNVRVAEGEETKSGKIFVDINGSTKPNVFGIDVFLLNRKVEDEKGGVVVPLCSDKTTEEVKGNCTTTGLRTCCAEMIKRAGWKIEKDYPWK